MDVFKQLLRFAVGNNSQRITVKAGQMATMTTGEGQVGIEQLGVIQPQFVMQIMAQLFGPKTQLLNEGKPVQGIMDLVGVGEVKTIGTLMPAPTVCLYFPNGHNLFESDWNQIAQSAPSTPSPQAAPQVPPPPPSAAPPAGVPQSQNANQSLDDELELPPTEGEVSAAPDMVAPPIPAAAPADMTAPPIPAAASADMTAPPIPAAAPADMTAPPMQAAAPADMTAPPIQAAAPADMTAPPADMTAPPIPAAAPADMTAPPADMTAPPIPAAAPADMTAPPADMTAPPADMTAPPAEMTAPPADMTAPPQDLAMPPADLAQMPQDLSTAAETPSDPISPSPESVTPSDLAAPPTPATDPQEASGNFSLEAMEDSALSDANDPGPGEGFNDGIAVKEFTQNYEVSHLPGEPPSNIGGQPVETPMQEQAPVAMPAPEAAPSPIPTPVQENPVVQVATTSSSPVKIDFGIPEGDKSSSNRSVELDAILQSMLDKGASDLHLSVTEPVCFRIDGEVWKDESGGVVTPEKMESLLYNIMPPRNREEFADCSDTDFAYEIPDVARFRVNMFRNRFGVAAVLRHIPSKILTAQQLNLNPTILNFCKLHKGLVLVTGPTGSGKSTTLAAMIDHINKTRNSHIITVEDPVEFVYESDKCIINQREVGRHTGSFNRALRAALREDPDIVLVGEMRDLETIAMAIETAETGHLVFGTLHTNTAISTVDRIVDQFPADRQAQIRVMLSEGLKGVVSQNLLKKKGGGRVAVQEILVVTKALSAIIREGKTHMMGNQMTSSRAEGNILLNEALLKLVTDGVVDPMEAYIKAVEKAEFANLLQQKGFNIGDVETEEKKAS